MKQIHLYFGRTKKHYRIHADLPILVTDKSPYARFQDNRLIGVSFRVHNLCNTKRNFDPPKLSQATFKNSSLSDLGVFDIVLGWGGPCAYACT